VSLYRHGEGQAAAASVEGEHIITLMLGAINNWYGRIEVEKVEANGKPTT